MNTIFKLFVGFVTAGLMLIFVAFAVLPQVVGWGVSTAVAATRGKAERNLAEIVAVSIPQGFIADYALKASGYTAAGFRRAESEHLVFIQGPADLQIDDANLNEMTGNQYSRNGRNMVPVSQDPLTVRGMPAKMVMSEGLNSSKQPYRQVMVLFQGVNGPVMLNYSGPIATWNQLELDEILASIR